ncbi:MAG TPA: hypothetical protein VGF82_24120 [Terracidiphilus sp.]
MATQSVLPDDTSSREENHAHANQMIVMNGAVRRRMSARFIFVAAIIRLARLCVLISEPLSCPAPDPQDLAGSGILDPVQRLSIKPACLPLGAAESDSGKHLRRR